MYLGSYSLIIKNLFLRMGIYDLIRRYRPNHKVAILRYHAVVDPHQNFYTSPAISLSPPDFETHVQYLTRKYRVISLDYLINLMRNGDLPSPNCVVFTFDDGYADNLIAARTLKKYAGTGTFYITTEPVERKGPLWLASVTYLILKTVKSSFKLKENGKTQNFEFSNSQSRWEVIRQIIRIVKSNDLDNREDVMMQVYDQLGDSFLLAEVENLMLTVPQLIEMNKMGMTIGSHTLTHLNLPNAKQEDAIREISKSKLILENHISASVRHFSYPNSGPYSYFNSQIRDMTKEAGYESATTSEQGFVHSKSDLFALKRIRTVSNLAEIIHSLEWDRIFNDN